ncbi:hypothetical protein IE81DRAFT_35245 [Ceraceosorus guamensis]|uniref:Uncharacterized protein n=1 Tax=Ceraceosorus guamensis TaxID=1522189 RepID=A0A316VSV1_9BASI|nr:hypothetical protein IE81DRAFT_35245 [Ceraceosorus guamensis]PWN39291.1 hypothetical protein IE81DRAFT_35245 [Ceraceosorus guamensis]
MTQLKTVHMLRFMVLAAMVGKIICVGMRLNNIEELSEPLRTNLDDEPLRSPSRSPDASLLSTPTARPQRSPSPHPTDTSERGLARQDSSASPRFHSPLYSDTNASRPTFREINRMQRQRERLEHARARAGARQTTTPTTDESTATSRRRRRPLPNGPYGAVRVRTPSRAPDATITEHQERTQLATTPTQSRHALYREHHERLRRAQYQAQHEASFSSEYPGRRFIAARMPSHRLLDCC